MPSNVTGEFANKSWADIDAEETAKQQRRESELLDEVVEVIDNVVEENKKVMEQEQDYVQVQEVQEVVQEVQEVQQVVPQVQQVVPHAQQQVVNDLPILAILNYNLSQLLDAPAKRVFNTNDINEITKIIIGRGGFHLKNITYQSGAISIWCRDTTYNNVVPDKSFDVSVYSSTEHLYSSQIAFWMLKRRANIVVNEYYNRRMQQIPTY
tara:strand:- start:97 stop:723 length:627 start_codon:yes stop_codon:yes gene_type:complete